TRVEPATYRRGARTPAPDAPAPLSEFVRPGQPAYRLLDIPSEILGVQPRGVYMAAWADPWPGSVALFEQSSAGAFEPVDLIRRPSRVGRLMEPLPSMRPHLWSRGPGVVVEMLSGTLSSAPDLAVLNGQANLAALASPEGGWELLRFQSAELVGPGQYRISRFLRGFAGTEPLMGDPTPEGAYLILLDEGLIRFERDPVDIGSDSTFRIGPGAFDVGDESYAQAEWTYEGVRFRPLSPVKLRAVRQPDDSVRVTWVRRSIQDDDSWPEGEAPILEGLERYRVQVRSGGSTLRTEETSSPEFSWTGDMQAADGFPASVRFDVAQVSASFGPGLEGKVTFDE
ncbi:MAG: hypothetical protein AAFU61_08015, partial [Pseudomonadota bacterium]